jgi:protein-export membrane protein SecD
VTRRRLVLTLLLTVGIAWGSLVGSLAADWSPELGLDLQGGFSVVLTAPEGADRDVLEKAVDIMRLRIETIGNVQEPEISIQGDRRILVQLPGVEDRERALEAVGTTGELSFRPVFAADIISPAFLDGTLPFPEELLGTDPDAPETSTTTTTEPPPVPDNIDPVLGLTIVDDVTQSAYLQGDDGLAYSVGPAFLTGADIAGAEPAFTGSGLTTSSGWVVDPSFTSDGAAKFEAATAVLSTFPSGDPRRQMAIVVDGRVFSAPQISEQILPGESLDAENVIITVGNIDPEKEAEDLATILRYGALPTTFEREREESVSASLGSDSLRAGLFAGFGGLALVAMALIVYYRALGVVAVVGLTVFGSFLFVGMTLLSRYAGVTLTLAGVTGVIVSIGITADSYIVFFERIKEEHRRGRPLRAAADAGFHRAFRTILTADFVTAAGSALLWMLAIGPVKVFAIALGISTVIDVLVAYYYTRPAVLLLVRSRAGEGGALTVRGAMGRSAHEAAEAVS